MSHALGIENTITVDAGFRRLEGWLRIPANPVGLVLFAHGSGSSRSSPRNRFVADVLCVAGLGTLLFDLLTIEEADDRDNVFDVELLAARLELAMSRVDVEPDAHGLRLGLFGASTGAAAALIAAANQPTRVGAVVSRGGRPDLADSHLCNVRAPTLLVVGGDDEPVIRLNEHALAQLNCDKELVVVPGATHLFSEPGALDLVARLARDWFVRHLGDSNSEVARVP
ncbi:MAG: dienelactone hydrolase family protein [Planctomycetes bacterium]|nr:dienelactone hydrolase family protein [Planctomycetota bacterium]